MLKLIHHLMHGPRGETIDLWDIISVIEENEISAQVKRLVTIYAGGATELTPEEKQQYISRKTLDKSKNITKQQTLKFIFDWRELIKSM